MHVYSTTRSNYYFLYRVTNLNKVQVPDIGDVCMELDGSIGKGIEAFRYLRMEQNPESKILGLHRENWKWVINTVNSIEVRTWANHPKVIMERTAHVLSLTFTGSYYTANVTYCIVSFFSLTVSIFPKT